ncbi:hypothetical protein RJT34_14726 [Clitoria ternatea]|uniref:Uncharacterized protein n=1 Tax=Clitoria ternatea TaxID=43366 RepID=A0AAN9JT42_CLITE
MNSNVNNTLSKFRRCLISLYFFIVSSSVFLCRELAHRLLPPSSFSLHQQFLGFCFLHRRARFFISHGFGVRAWNIVSQHVYE